MFMQNTCLTTALQLLSALENLLTTDFRCFASKEDFQHVAKAKISVTAKAVDTAHRMWKIYKKLQDEFFQVQQSIFCIGSPSHSLNALVVDYYSLSRHGCVCPHFSEMVSRSIQKRVSLFSIVIPK